MTLFQVLLLVVLAVGLSAVALAIEGLTKHLRERR
jgi:hypothetical protein